MGPHAVIPRRVVVTGMGPIAPNGIGKSKFWHALLEGRSGIKAITSFRSSSYPTRIAGEISDFDPLDYLSVRQRRRMGRSTQFAVAAAQMALDDAGAPQPVPRGTGVVIGTSTAMMDLVESGHQALLERGLARIPPSTAKEMLPHAPAMGIASHYRCTGPCLTISTSCAGGLNAIGMAYDCIRFGKTDMMLAGGTDAQITPLVVALLCAARMLSQRNEEPERACRPFDRTRDGGVLSEGAGVLLLEEREQALQRNATIYGEIVGYAVINEAVEIPDAELTVAAVSDTIQKALEEARLTAHEIDYICAHAPSSEFDAQETEAIKRVLGDHAYEIPVSSIKSMIGNPLAAAGPLQVATALLAIQHGLIPPTINYEHPDPDCDLNYVPNTVLSHSPDVVLINSHGFGGIDVSLLVRRDESGMQS